MWAQSSTNQGDECEDIIQLTEFHPSISSTIYYHGAHDTVHEKDKLDDAGASNRSNETESELTASECDTMTYSVVCTQMFVTTELEEYL